MTTSRTLAFRTDSAARLRLFCLPYAGAGASLFSVWARSLSRDVQVCPIQPPGRENRLGEKPYTDIYHLVSDLADSVERVLDLPYALFGHSMGAAVAFELSRELRRRDRRAPLRLIASGFRAPHLLPRLPPISGEPQPRFLDAVQKRYGAIAEEVLREPDLIALIVPPLRADLMLIERYRCTNEAPLGCPITVFGGTSDHTVTDAELDDWRLHTTAGFDRATITGGHFFVKDSRVELLAALERCLLSTGA